ncbi:MAG: D-alanyl-D-alanine carboxypeptidase, partial [Solirubrobacteraceae bacterium]
MTGTFYVHVNRIRPLQLRILLCGLSLFAALTPAAARAAGSLAGLQSDLAHQMTLAGPHDGAYVYDLTAKQALFSDRATTMRPPASVEKLYTATTAIEQLGATARLETTVMGVGHLAPGGIWEGNLYLHGGGDPTFGSTSFIRSHYGGVGTSVATLVTQLVRVDGIHHIVGSIEG